MNDWEQEFLICIVLVPNMAGVCLEKTNLDHVLVQGDLLNKSLNTYDILSVDELLRSINSIQIEYLELETKIATITDDDLFLRNILPSNNVILLLSFMDGYKTTLKT